MIGNGAGALAGSRLYSGWILGPYPFLDAVRDGVISYGTWHVTPAIRSLVADGVIDFYPVRASQVPALIDHLNIEIVLVRVSPPDKHGFCNLGPAVSYPALAARGRIVIAEIDPDVPCVRGEGVIHESEIFAAIDSEEPMPEYPRAKVDAGSKAIARHIVGLLPDSPTIQIGIGSIPEAVVQAICELGIGNLRFAGVGLDGIADLHAAGLLAADWRAGLPPVTAAELMGTKQLMGFASDNHAVAMYGMDKSINPVVLSRIDRFVSINSALQIDVSGQVAADSLGPLQISGIGGSVDFAEAAMHSSGGVQIIALSAQHGKKYQSKLVNALASGTMVTLGRHSVEYVVTEYGVARLGLASQRERAEALDEIFQPADRGYEIADAE